MVIMNENIPGYPAPFSVQKPASGSVASSFIDIYGRFAQHEHGGDNNPDNK